ncbi:PLP-dependent aminotransferase family protein [Oceanimonas baumannii]|uniref:DNA-binding transcriptional MocR family regulator n=1 Tax=Oceanimonas baumannii TaxID=129578 RepID=A0A235CK88_9GAMM|nr:PLP-dependent aminotransferase family protein [Oceanimonas baumannii]OYD24940.1 GntR family transcriptional regulator [Oceanimonas baumannii]TDW59705.1 DNA-binding transcriptional MocR family regulator [Oceanimonas baumannii]
MTSKYRRLARQLQGQIEAGVWQSGDKLPSLRDTVKQSGFSLMTVLNAYQLLESQGWILAQPQSGYRVAPRQHSPANTARPALHAAEAVDINAFIFNVLQAGQRSDCVAFGSAFPDSSLFPQEQLARSLSRVARHLTPDQQLVLPPGCAELRRAIARRYAARGTEVAPEEIVITSGALEALNLSLQVLTRPGDWVVVEAPAFYGALQAIERLQLKALAVPVDVASGLDLGALADALGRYPVKACWLMSHCQNPLGVSLGAESRSRLLALLREHQVPLIEDDVYAELYDGEQAPLPLRALDRDVLHCSSFSKTLATGLRIGWVSAGERAPDIQRLQLMSTLSTSAPMQLALADYLASHHYDRHLHTLRRVLLQRKQRFYKALCQQLPEQVCVHPGGGYFLWLSLPDGMDATRLYHRALSEDITIAPGRMFAAGDQFRHCFRLNVSLPWNSRTEAAIARLAALARELIQGC